jgi:hypothetical protein
MTLAGVALALLVAGRLQRAWSYFGTDHQTKQTQAPQTLDSIGSRATDSPLTSDLERKSRVRDHASLRSQAVGKRLTPIVGAQISWTVLRASTPDTLTSWPDLNWDEIEASSAFATSDPLGYFEFSHPPNSQAGVTSVIWITAPGYLARRVLLDYPTSHPALPQVIELEPAGLLTTRVVDLHGAPVPGATLTQLSYLGTVDPALRPEYELDAILVLRRKCTTNAAGEAALSSFPGLNWIWAEHNSSVSLPWSGRAPSQFSLTVGDTYSIKGMVFAPPQSSLEKGLSIRATAYIDSEPRTITRTRVRPDGAWGPEILPVITCDRIALQLEGDLLTQELVNIPAPTAGEQLTVDFRPDPAIQFKVRVIDVNDRPREGSLVEASWYARDAWHTIIRCTDAAGIARMSGCHPANFYVLARASGYAASRMEVAVTDSPSEPIEIKLLPSGTLHGRCTFHDLPVSDFRIHWWQQPDYRGDSALFHETVDGQFELADVPLGELWVMPSSLLHSQGPPRRVTVVPDAVAEVDLQLQDNCVGRGQIVDGVTSQPIPGSEIQLFVSNHGTRLQAIRSPALANEDGFFDLEGLTTGVNVFEVSAPGYQRAEVLREITSTSSPDLGIVPLFSKRALEVTLESGSDIRFEEYRAVLIRDIELPSRQFSARGVLRFENLDPGLYTLRIISPGDSNYQDLTVELSPKSDRSVHVPIADDSMIVEVIAQAGQIIPDGLNLRVRYLGGEQQAVDHVYGIPASGRVDVMAVEGVVTVDVLELDRTCRGFVRTRVEHGVPSTIRVHLDDRPLEFRVLDGSGSAFPGALVALFCSPNCADWFAQATSDPNGICHFSGIALDEVFVNVGRLPEGFMPAVKLNLRTASGAPTDLRLIPDCVLQVSVLERGKPMSGVQLQALDAQVPAFLGASSSDAQGTATFCRVGRGNWRVTLAHPGYWEAQYPVTASCDGIPVPVEVRRLGSAELRVTDSDGLPVPEASIDMRSEEMGEWASEWIAKGRVASTPGSLTTDIDGRIRLSGLPNGPFRWQVVPPQGGLLEGIVTVPPQGLVEVPISLP